MTRSPRQKGQDSLTAPQRGRRQMVKPSPLTWADARCEATGTGWFCAMPVPVSGNRIWRHAKGRTFQASQHKTDKEQARLRFGSAGVVRGEVTVTVLWVRKARRGDIDNFGVKPVLDVLKGVLFEDDGQVVALRVIRSDQTDRPAGCYVWVAPAGQTAWEAA